MLPSPAWTIRNATIFPRACCYDITRADVLRCGGGTESSGGERSQTCLTPDFFEPTVDAWGRTSDSDGGPLRSWRRRWRAAPIEFDLPSPAVLQTRTESRSAGRCTAIGLLSVSGVSGHHQCLRGGRGNLPRQVSPTGVQRKMRAATMAPAMPQIATIARSAAAKPAPATFGL